MKKYLLPGIMVAIFETVAITLCILCFACVKSCPKDALQPTECSDTQIFYCLWKIENGGKI